MSDQSSPEERIGARLAAKFATAQKTRSADLEELRGLRQQLESTTETGTRIGLTRWMKEKINAIKDADRQLEECRSELDALDLKLSNRRGADAMPEIVIHNHVTRKAKITTPRGEVYKVEDETEGGA